MQRFAFDSNFCTSQVGDYSFAVFVYCFLFINLHSVPFSVFLSRTLLKLVQGTLNIVCELVNFVLISICALLVYLLRLSKARHKDKMENHHKLTGSDDEAPALPRYPSVHPIVSRDPFLMVTPDKHPCVAQAHQGVTKVGNQDTKCAVTGKSKVADNDPKSKLPADLLKASDNCILAQPKIYTTNLVSKNLYDVLGKKFDAKTALLNLPDDIQAMVDEEITSALNYKPLERKYTGLLSLDFDSEIVTRGAQRKEFVARKKRSDLKPEIMDLWSDDLIVDEPNLEQSEFELRHSDFDALEKDFDYLNDPYDCFEVFRQDMTP